MEVDECCPPGNPDGYADYVRSDTTARAQPLGTGRLVRNRHCASTDFGKFSLAIVGIYTSCPFGNRVIGWGEVVILPVTMRLRSSLAPSLAVAYRILRSIIRVLGKHKYVRNPTTEINLHGE